MRGVGETRRLMASSTASLALREVDRGARSTHTSANRSTTTSTTGSGIRWAREGGVGASMCDEEDNVELGLVRGGLRRRGLVNGE